MRAAICQVFAGFFATTRHQIAQRNQRVDGPYAAPFTEVDLVLIAFGLEARTRLLPSCRPMSSEKTSVRGGNQ